ncbi:MAG: DUF5103 domain-containing protein [Bacteroidia bacterium]|nr:DUF5103 domain-containing protein [Bacteroidia bacterium]
MRIIWLTLGVAGLLAGCQSSSGTLKPRPAPEPLVMGDAVNETNIRSVQFYRGRLEASYPVLYLDVAQPLTLEFDELLPEDRRESDFFVDFINCDARWQPSNLLPIEFYEGFSQKRIDLFRRSEFTRLPYVHYSFSFPQDGEAFKISGNYILKVYRGSDPDHPVLTRRFVVADRRIGIGLKYLLDGRLERQQLRQFSFEIQTQGLRVFNPALDLQVMVLQNFRWDQPARLQQPVFQSEGRFEYQINLEQQFRSGNEYRFHDVASVRFLSESIQEVYEGEDLHEVYLFADTPRLRNALGSRMDRNGSFFIRVQEWPDPDIQADYVRNVFTLRAPPRPEGEAVYLTGRFCDWQARPEYRMAYSDSLGMYQAEILLKQGSYDYAYTVLRPGERLPDESLLEGPHFEGENFYTILVYYREPGDRSDRLIGYQPVNYYD